LTTGVLAAGFGVTGVVFSAFAVTAVGALYALRRSRNAPDLPLKAIWVDTGRATVALVLFWIIVSIDVPIARHTLSAEQAGQYTAASVIGKAVLWLPGAISLVMFPRVAQLREAGEKTHPLLIRCLAITSVLCAVAVLALKFIGPTLIPIFFGSSYAAGGRIAWQIGLVCLPFALANLLIFYHLTREDGRFSLALGVGLMLELASFARFHETLGHMIAGLAVGSVAVIVGLVLPGTLRRVRDARGWASAG
jgi:O-antigen/teichoic acid export membrane protein